MGLMLAVEIVVDEAGGDRTPDPKATLTFFEETKSRNLLIGKGGLKGNVIRISPPLTISEGEVDQALNALDGAFAAISA